MSDAALSVLSVASEAFPLVKTGGLADVAGALPRAVSGHGITMATCLPGYPKVKAALGSRVSRKATLDLLGHSVAVLETEHPSLGLLYVLDCPPLYEREGGPYVGPDGLDHADNWLRFAVFSKAAERIAAGACGPVFDCLHAHDWQAGLVPAYAAFSGDFRPSVMTIHNIAFQGQFGMGHFPMLDLPEEARGLNGVEYWGDISFLKAGLVYATAITTVSPTYAREILTPAFGMGLDGMIAARSGDLSGIVNGLDLDAWNPATDAHLAERYDLQSLGKRRNNRQPLQERFGLSNESEPMICGIVSRLTHQKGMDIVLGAVDAMVAEGIQLVVLGSGDRDLEDGFRAAAARHPGSIGVEIGYDEALSHQIHAGVDALLVPSRFEPCGLTQLSALRYGAIPIVARTGGLADTIIDANHAGLVGNAANGIQFSDLTVGGFLDAVRRLAAIRTDKKAFDLMQRRAMRSDVSWDRSAAEYAALYRKVCGR